MAEKDIGALLVVENEKPIGMISEREYARKVVLKGHLATDTKVGDIMREQVEYARPNQTVQECMAMVTELRHRHLPVLENDKVVGVVSIGDLVKAVIDHQQFVIEQLEDYIVR